MNRDRTTRNMLVSALAFFAIFVAGIWAATRFFSPFAVSVAVAVYCVAAASALICMGGNRL